MLLAVALAVQNREPAWICGVQRLSRRLVVRLLSPGALADSACGSRRRGKSFSGAELVGPSSTRV